MEDTTSDIAKFTKTDLAKFENTWNQKPHIVSRGGEKNFVEYMAEIFEKKPPVPDEEYFRSLVAKAILFHQTEDLVQSQKYGGYTANIVTYSLAWLSHRTAQQIDLELIWKPRTLNLGKGVLLSVLAAWPRKTDRIAPSRLIRAGKYWRKRSGSDSK